MRPPPLKTYPDLAAAAVGRQRRRVDYLFADGVSLALWIGGTDAADCCALRRRPLSRKPLLRRGHRLRAAQGGRTLCAAPSSYALQRLWDEGKYAELYLRFFPISPF